MQMRTIGYIVASILIFFGVLFIWGAFGAQGQPGWIVIGIITVSIGLVLFYFTSKKPKTTADSNITLKLDLPANVNLDTIKCRSCGGTLSAENIKVINGAPVVTCPYCSTVYQLTEDPKW
jgi:hypothetical protein